MIKSQRIKLRSKISSALSKYDFLCETGVQYFPRMVQLVLIIFQIKQTVQIESSTVEIEERGVRLRLTVVDTPGYGDAIDNREASLSTEFQP